MQAVEINEFIRSRRSVFTKQFNAGKPVDDEIIKQILVNATWAPNHGHAEPWQFTVFCGEGLKSWPHFKVNYINNPAAKNLYPPPMRSYSKRLYWHLM